MTGSAGKTFSGPQSGVMVWNDPELTPPLLDAVFPALAATHQVNRVAALAAAAAELLAFGPEYMAAVVANAQALAHALQTRGVPVLGAHKGYTRTHQVIADVREFGGGLDVAHRLAEANLITNKNLLPNDQPEDWDRPSGLRIGTTEVTRLGMGEVEMRAIADMIAGVLVEGRDPEHVRAEAIELRAGHQTHPLLLHRITSTPMAVATELDLETLKRVEQRVLWLATSIVHHANRVRENRSRREGRRPPGEQRVDGEPDDRAVLRRPRGAGPRQRQAAREPGPARDQPPARPAGPPLPDDAARVRRAAVLPEPHEGPRPGRLLAPAPSASAPPRRSGARSRTATSPATSTSRAAGARSR